MAEAPGTLEGWYALHDFRRIDWGRWKALNSKDQIAVMNEATAFFRSAEQVSDAPEGSSAVYSMVGHKSDLLILHLRSTVDHLAAIERGFAQTRLADYTVRTGSYLSVTELSLYEATARGGSQDPAELMASEFVQRRLKPPIPDKKYVCFYPMNKRRGEVENWYTASMEDRSKMMRQHASTGRKYTDSITQMITGSMGLDDWEWGVTLFSTDPLPIKKLVSEMRFDEVTARYAEFGTFQVGVRLPAAQLAQLFARA